MAAARDKSLPIELRLAAAGRAAPFYHARVSASPPKAAYEMTDYELRTAIEREKQHLLRVNPGQRLAWWRTVQTTPERCAEWIGGPEDSANRSSQRLPPTSRPASRGPVCSRPMRRFGATAGAKYIVLRLVGRPAHHFVWNCRQTLHITKGGPRSAFP